MPAVCAWSSRDYVIKLRSTVRLESLSMVPKNLNKKKTPKSLVIQPPIDPKLVCTWEDLESCRGKSWKNSAGAAGPDLILIDDRTESRLIVGIDAKSDYRNKKQLATQFIQSLESSPPVAILFSIRCRKQASEMYQLVDVMDAIYSEVYDTLRVKDPEFSKMMKVLYLQSISKY
ncbi:hypothetical protein GEMRC1_009519 [Eukaryota sp. GEM-RC1]